ncbi:GH25 family lysozyme [Mycobacterium sp. 236(2023)]|uniref:GH25 family lysozyme n=1 Tax=Mycobacterium sp. 236(2023) TaxID=3038163 RepID=UPI002414FC2C|nr:GH25 family lysozyme [Mycobacterium sp. 236(2023)]MDG4669064.1 GH25 family lysozyme [Mycobacterium sp. 236(2023)]
MGAVERRPGVLTGPLGDRMIAFLERYPKADQIYITSGRDGNHGSVSHHYGLQHHGSQTAALDIGAGSPPDAAQMRDFAKWLYDNYSDATVELIHSTPFPDDDGFYVKNQIKNPGGSIYGGPQAIGHFDHIHWATSDELLARLERNGQSPVETITTRRHEPVVSADVDLVWGWDASDHDWERGPMNLVEAQRDGISFFVHKATEGRTWKAKHYREALERARNAGIPVLGTYHFLWPEEIEEQVGEWMNFVDAETPWWRDVAWIWQIDAEVPKAGVRAPSAAEITTAVNAVNRRMAAQGARAYVIVYAPNWVYGDSLAPSYDIWNSNYNGSGAPRAFKEQYQGVTNTQAGWNPMSGRKPKILQFASDGQVGSQNTCDVNKFDGSLHDLIRLCGRDPGRVDNVITIPVTEKVLSYDRSIPLVRQDTGFFCGPAASQIVLDSLGIRVREHDLAPKMGTDENGTDSVHNIRPVLHNLVPAAGFTAVEMPHDPPTGDEREMLWRNIVRSIDSGYGVVMNWVAPVGNHPRGVKGSVNPNYGNRTVRHYVACMGYDSNPALRAVWIADSGFSPFGYWVSFDQVATLIPPKGYIYAAAAQPVSPAVPVPPVVAAAPAPHVAPTPVTDWEKLRLAIAGVDPEGWPLEWRYAHSRSARDFNEIVADPDRGPWQRLQPDGTRVAGHTDAFEQIVPISEQIAWRHTFSDGLTRDLADVLFELMEFAIQWRREKGSPASAFVGEPEPNGTPTPAPRRRSPRKAAARPPRKTTAPAAASRPAEPITH